MVSRNTGLTLDALLTAKPSRGPPPMTRLSSRLAWITLRIVTAGLLAWAIVPSNPSAYYQFHRVAVFAAGIALAWRHHTRGQPGWVVAFGVVAVMYNPVVPVHLTRPIWAMVNLATIAVVLAPLWIAGHR